LKQWVIKNSILKVNGLVFLCEWPCFLFIIKSTAMIKDVAKWLKSAPRKSEVVEIQNGKDKVKIIPQKIIESLLDELTEQNWSTKYFQFSRFTETITLADGTQGAGRAMCDASLELVVTYRVMEIGPLTVGAGPTMVEKEITRTLVGAYTFDTALFGDQFTANTAKSLCISNAASDLGRRFGKDLNPKEAAMMILGIKKPVAGQVTAEATNKIMESLDKIKEKIQKDGKVAG